MDVGEEKDDQISDNIVWRQYLGVAEGCIRQSTRGGGMSKRKWIGVVFGLKVESLSEEPRGGCLDILLGI